MGLNVSTNLPMFVYTFQAMWRHRPLEEYLVFVGIRAAHTSFSPFTLSEKSEMIGWEEPQGIDGLCVINDDWKTVGYEYV